MKALDDSLTETRKKAHRCFIHPDSLSNPAIRELIYCSIMFIAEATKAACGCRPQSSSRLAKELADTRNRRIRLYRGEAKRHKLPKASSARRNNV
jgi:hypothetical protein